MRADDDGFIGNPKKIMRMIGASEDDLKILLAKKFLINFDNSVDGLYLTICEAIDAYKNEAYRERIMKEARMTACRFSISKTIEDLENIYINVLES